MIFAFISSFKLLLTVSQGAGKKRPSVETDGLNDCLPYEKKVYEFAERLSSSFFNNIVNKRYYLFVSSEKKKSIDLSHSAAAEDRGFKMNK